MKLDKMKIKEIVQNWFKMWESGDFEKLTLCDDFKHTSPFGTTEGKETYLNLVREHKDKFLGYQFDIQDEMYESDKACVRYTAIQGDFRMDVSEWHYLENDLIKEIVAYYHIGEIREERQFNEGAQ